MLVLGIDTATWTAAVGVARDGVVLAEGVHRESRSHASSLAALVERVLAEAGADLAAVDAVAVSIGPGSFTGLRIGLAFAKGVAYAGGLALAAVPTLEALAWSAEASPDQRVCVALDARKREVYAAFFRGSSPPVRLVPDAAWPPTALAAQLDSTCIVVGDAAAVYPELASCAVVRPFTTHHPRGGVVARLGWERLAAGDAAPLGTVEPVYVRPPDATPPRSR